MIMEMTDLSCVPHGIFCMVALQTSWNHTFSDIGLRSVQGGTHAVIV